MGFALLCFDRDLDGLYDDVWLVDLDGMKALSGDDLTAVAGKVYQAGLQLLITRGWCSRC